MPRDPKPSIDYDVKFIALEFGAGTESERSGLWLPPLETGLTVFQEEIKKVFSKSKMFSEFDAGTASGKYKASLVLQRKARYGYPSFLESYYNINSRIISVLTLFVIPTREKYDYFLAIDVNEGDQLLKQYQYKQRMDTWVQFPFLLFLGPTHTRGKIEREIIDNMLLNFLYDLQNDKILEVLSKSD